MIMGQRWQRVKRVGRTRDLIARRRRPARLQQRCARAVSHHGLDRMSEATDLCDRHRRSPYDGLGEELMVFWGRNIRPGVRESDRSGDQHAMP